MLLALATMWLVSEILHKDKEHEHKQPYLITNALRRIDFSCVLFFLGLLLAVSALQYAGYLYKLADIVSGYTQNLTIVVTLIGLFSAIIDNVPLVAAAMGMYPLAQMPTDSYFWHLLAYTAGTGGSILIIGSAAGVAAMGMEKIEFFTYCKKVSILALISYFSGIIFYFLQKGLMVFILN
jgi:Na+/H+ antiporter NhaD/arsenite permease-like protein